MKTASGPARPPLRGTILFALGALCVAGASGLLAYGFYVLAGKPITDFYAKLGELALQLSVVVIIGALLKAILDWGTTQRARDLEKVETRLEFMRRVRSVHVRVENSRDLMNAHGTPKTYAEQSRKLMELRPEIEEIAEDLKASEALFARQQEIIAGLEGISSYLQEGAEEYIRSHEAVSRGFVPERARQSFLDTVEQERMGWVKDFMSGGAGYRDKYLANLGRAKGTMRAEVYGA